MGDHSDELKPSIVNNPMAEELARAVSLRALTHMIGPVGGRDVLDLACGDGALSRWLARHGARVTGIDSSVETIEAARKMEAGETHGIRYSTGSPQDLYIVEDSAFDDVVCNLSLERVENLGAVVAEVARVIRLGGRFIFSVSHPCFALRLVGEAGDDYFADVRRDGPSGTIHHRTLSSYINAVAARGFMVRRVLEPAADEHDISQGHGLDSWRHLPVVLVVEAVFPHL